MSVEPRAPGYDGVTPEDESEAGSTRGPVMPDGLDRAHPTPGALVESFGDAILRHEVMSGDEHVVFVEPSRSFDILEWLRNDPDHLYNYLSDVTAVDFGGGRPLQVVWQLYSIPYRRALRVKAELPLDALEVQSVEPLWKSANWLEREVYDLFGIRFSGHPDLRRILMPTHYAEGHPLRKDFPLRGRFSRAEQTRRALELNADDYYVDAQRGPGREPQLVEWQELGGEPVPVEEEPESSSTSQSSDGSEPA